MQQPSHHLTRSVRLCLAGEPLPAAVAASGAGYTLSGKLLDPSSAAAAAYGFKPELLSRELVLRGWVALAQRLLHGI